MSGMICDRSRAVARRRKRFNKENGFMSYFYVILGGAILFRPINKACTWFLIVEFYKSYYFSFLAVYPFQGHGGV